MSMDAGGLAQMTYNNNFAPNGGLGMPGAGFASRGKGAQLKRLSVASPPKIGSISENHVDPNPTPRTSKAHFLAGLRTAPKTPSAVPASAPYLQQQHRWEDAKQVGSGHGYNMPQTATATGFGQSARSQYVVNAGQQVYSLPEQVLAPPSLQLNSPDEEQMDPNLLNQLLATELYLQQRQQQLQQQLLQLTGQYQGLNLNNNNNGGYRHPQQFPQTPMTPNMGFYQQQLQNGGSMPQEVPGQPGTYVVYNPMTGQYQYVVDPNAQQQVQLANSPPPPTPSYTSSPPKASTPTFRAEVSPPADESIRRSPFDSRSSSPPKKSPSPPADVIPLPPPSANAFRRGHHKKVSSLAFNVNNDSVSDGPKSAFTRSFPQTPMTGTFGPGQARAGEHPTRQPRGPPPLEELQAAPTTKHEGTKNFATRQRRRALNSLVRAGIERRGVRSGSGGSMTPVSETEMNFSIPSDDDSVHSHSSKSLSGKSSIGSLRAAASGAIGSERKEMKERSRERGSVDAMYTANSVSSDEGVGIGGRLVEVRVEEVKPASEERRKTPLLVLTSAEKRKSSMF